jgi:hypothetical protein
MAPKYHPTPLSGGDRKALNKELGEAGAKANILATQSADMWAKGEGPGSPLRPGTAPVPNGWVAELKAAESLSPPE